MRLGSSGNQLTAGLSLQSLSYREPTGGIPIHQCVCANGDQSSVWMSSSPILSFEAEPLLLSTILHVATPRLLTRLLNIQAEVLGFAQQGTDGLNHRPSPQTHFLLAICKCTSDLPQHRSTPMQGGLKLSVKENKNSYTNAGYLMPLSHLSFFKKYIKRHLLQSHKSFQGPASPTENPSCSCSVPQPRSRGEGNC